MFKGWLSLATQTTWLKIGKTGVLGDSEPWSLVSSSETFAAL